jgi:MYXO-CTERM domain-containing protein
MRTLLLTLVAGATLAGLAGVASAQSFPADDRYRPLRCGHHIMRDGRADEPPNLDERDLVGEDDFAAGLRASDADFLYLRLRVDADALPGGTIAGYSWGIAFDTDGDHQTYEILGLVDGVSGNLLLYRNTQTTTRNDATDPADTPAAKTYAVADRVRSTEAPTATNAPDYYLTFALPWADLKPLGLDHRTRVRVYAASSTATNALNGDFACHSGGGAAHFSDMDSDETVADPDVDSDGDGSSDADEVENGSDPDDPASRPGAGGGLELAGGGGCSVGAPGGGAGGAVVALALAALAFAWRRRRVRARRIR